MRGLTGSITFLIILILLDLYIFQAVKSVTVAASPKLRTVVQVLYWVISIAVLLFFMAVPYLRNMETPAVLRNYVLAIGIGLLLAKIISLPFFVIDDLRRLMVWISEKLTRPASTELAGGSSISRSVFLSWLGIGVGSTLFGTLLYGFRNKYNYRVVAKELRFANLPKAFDGFKLVQISDIHSGSFTKKSSVENGIALVNKQEADLILFTGDLVNDRSEEIEPYKEVFGKLKATHGIFSTLGNHDYGDYFPWPDNDEMHKQKEASAGSRLMTPMQAANLQRLKQHHADMGWTMLNDEAASIRRGEASISLLGVQNISGKSNFKSYGDLRKAYDAAAKEDFKILMSHDPSHWDAEVIKNYPDIDLTLSGHTHGMQFGVEIPGFKWSPVQWVYKQWAGLYEAGEQKLYVNRGFGFIGYPGRVGILPEITVITLRTA